MQRTIAGLMATAESRTQISFSRLRAVKWGLIHLATAPDDHELGTSFVGLVQLNAGEWFVDEFAFELADMTLYKAPDKDYRVLYLRSVIATNVRRLRNARGLSQQAFALEIEMDRTYLGGVERGERNVSIDNVERIAEGLGVEPWTLLKQDDNS